MTDMPDVPRVHVIREEDNRYLPAGEYLISVWSDGMVTVAHRDKSWQTWWPPNTAEEEK